MVFSKNFTWFFCLFGSALIAYATSLSHPYLFDDESFLLQNQWLSLEYVEGFFRSFIPISNLSFIGYRPFVLASFALENDFFHLLPWVVRFNSLLLHALNAYLLFLLVQKNFVADTRSRWVPYAVSILFLLHPVQSNVIFLAWKRSDIMFCFGLFFSLWYFQAWVESREGRRHTLFFGFLGVIFAIFSKETALMLPFAVALVHLCFWKPQKSMRRLLFLLYLPMFLLWALHVWIVLYEQPRLLAQSSFYSQSFMPSNLQLHRWDYAKTQVVALLAYLRLCFMPNNLQVFHWVEPVRSIFHATFVFSFGLITASFVLAIFCWKKRNNILVSFSILWFFIFLIPTSSFVPLSMIIDEDRLYVPIVAFCIFVVWIFRSLERLFCRSTHIFRTCFGLLLLVYLSLIVARGQDWKSPLHLWTSNSLAYPQDPRSWLNLANAYSVNGDAQKAVFCFEKSLNLDPSYATAAYFYGEHLLRSHLFEQAQVQFQTSLRLGHFVSDSYMHLAVIQHRFYRDQTKAKTYFEKSLQLGTNNTMAMRNYAHFLASIDDIDGAFTLLKRAIRIAPWDLSTQLQIANLVWTTRRDTETTKTLLQVILKKYPGHPGALKLMGEVQK